MHVYRRVALVVWWSPQCTCAYGRKGRVSTSPSDDATPPPFAVLGGRNFTKLKNRNYIHIRNGAVYYFKMINLGSVVILWYLIIIFEPVLGEPTPTLGMGWYNN